MRPKEQEINKALTSDMMSAQWWIQTMNTPHMDRDHRQEATYNLPHMAIALEICSFCITRCPAVKLLKLTTKSKDTLIWMFGNVDDFSVGFGTTCSGFWTRSPSLLPRGVGSPRPLRMAPLWYRFVWLSRRMFTTWGVLCRLKKTFSGAKNRSRGRSETEKAWSVYLL